MAQHNFKPTIRKAKRYKAKASIMIEGLTGSGKTGLALCLAHALAGRNWEHVGLVDTENRSADLIVGQHSHLGIPFGEFLKVDLTMKDGYAPVNYVEAATALITGGAEAIVFDSTTHAWNREGGILDMVNRAEESGAVKKGNKFSAWNTPEVIANKNALFELIRSESYHVITTVRVKEKFSLEMGDDGRNKVKSLGEQQVQTEGLKYEPDLVLGMEEAGTTDKPPLARIIKSRYPMLIKDEVYEFTPALIEQIRQFLEEGADPAELLRLQHEEYKNGIIAYCKAEPGKKTVWDMIKQAHGFEGTNIQDIPLRKLKEMYLQLTSEGA